jgi:putative copper export protein
VPDGRRLPWDDDTDTPRPHGGTAERVPLSCAGAGRVTSGTVDAAGLYDAGIDPADGTDGDTEDRGDPPDRDAASRATYGGNARGTGRFGIGLSDGAGFDVPRDEWMRPARPTVVRPADATGNGSGEAVGPAPGTNGHGPHRDDDQPTAPPIRPSVVWAARDDPIEQTGPVRRSPGAAPEVEPPTRPTGRRPLAPWEALASDGAPVAPGGTPFFRAAPPDEPPTPEPRRSAPATSWADGQPRWHDGPPPPDRPATDEGAPPPTSWADLLPRGFAPEPPPCPTAPRPGAGEPTGSWADPEPPWRGDGPEASAAERRDVPVRRSLIAADYRPEPEPEDGDGLAAAPVARPAAQAAPAGPPGVDEPTAEQEALWAFTQRVNALRDEGDRRSGRVLPEWLIGEAPPRPPAPDDDASPARRAVSRGAVVLGLLALLAVGFLVLVVLRWPDGGEGPAAGVDGAITRSLLADRFLSVATWVENLTTVLVIGGVTFRLYVSRPVMSGRGASERLLFAAALAGIAACVVSFPLRALVVSGEGVRSLFDPDVLGLVLTSRFGDAACVRILALVLFALIVARPPKGWGRRVFVVGPQGSVVGFWSISRVTLERVACVVAGVTALVSFTFVGHPQASEPRGFLLASQSLHILAASTWFGGGVLLAMEIVRQRRSGTARTTAETVERFSTLAGVSVALVVISGIVLAHSQLAGLSALYETPYGRALVAKILFVGLVAAVGGYNHSVLVPAIAKEDDAVAWRRLGRTCAIEGSLIATGVLVMTAAMTSGGI